MLSRGRVIYPSTGVACNTFGSLNVWICIATCCILLGMISPKTLVPPQSLGLMHELVANWKAIIEKVLMRPLLTSFPETFYNPKDGVQG